MASEGGEPGTAPGVTTLGCGRAGSCTCHGRPGRTGSSAKPSGSLAGLVCANVNPATTARPMAAGSMKRSDLCIAVGESRPQRTARRANPHHHGEQNGQRKSGRKNQCRSVVENLRRVRVLLEHFLKHFATAQGDREANDHHKADKRQYARDGAKPRSSLHAE